ncbi:MAG TPA: MGMT family protein [Planctomycetota bacterium]|jgi:O-6-methylguanine DNA methyltransferase
MSVATFVFQLSSPLLSDGKNPEGELILMAVLSEKGLRGLSIADDRLPCPFCHGVEEFADPQSVLTRFEELKDTLLMRLSGHPAEIAWDQFDLDGHPQFQVRVWEAMHAIPFGQTRTYAQIAKAAGSPKATRAVGTACGANPVVLLIPCHRVVSSNGLGGFGSGISWKKRFLAMEGVDWRSFGRS